MPDAEPLAWRSAAWRTSRSPTARPGVERERPSASDAARSSRSSARTVPARRPRELASGRWSHRPAASRAKAGPATYRDLRRNISRSSSHEAGREASPGVRGDLGACPAPRWRRWALPDSKTCHPEIYRRERERLPLRVMVARAGPARLGRETRGVDPPAQGRDQRRCAGGSAIERANLVSTKDQSFRAEVADRVVSTRNRTGSMLLPKVACLGALAGRGSGGRVDGARAG